MIDWSKKSELHLSLKIDSSTVIFNLFLKKQEISVSDQVYLVNTWQREDPYRKKKKMKEEEAQNTRTLRDLSVIGILVGRTTESGRMLC